MEDTCKFKDCYFSELLDRQEQCPNYIKSYWKLPNESQSKVVHDCAPVRTMLMVQELYNRLIGLQKDSEQERNAHEKMAQGLLGVVQAVQEDRVVPVRRLDDTNTS